MQSVVDMESKETWLALDNKQKLEDLHWDTQQWKSTLQFIDGEVHFLETLLNSHSFEPNTPNLFERLQDYKAKLKQLSTKKNKLRLAISTHENQLGGILNCTDSKCDLQYYQKHHKTNTAVDDFILTFQELKLEIFNFAGGILKKKK